MITVRCPECNVKMKIHEAVITNPNTTTKCSICKKVFNAHQLFYKDLQKQLNQADNHNSVGQNLLNNQGKVDGTSVNSSSASTKLIDNSKEAKAWLIVHDEAAPPQTYDLFVGVNSCGREPHPIGNMVTIMTNDPYMSRKHFSVEVIERNSGCEFVLKDNFSKNQTHIDTKVLAEFSRQMRPLKEGEEIYIEDGALIEAGKTKIHFKVAKNKNKDVESNKILNQKFTKTVIISS